MKIAIGRNSNSDVYYKDISSLPHLFISYSYPEQLIALYKRYIAAIMRSKNTEVFLLFSAGTAGKLLPVSDFAQQPHVCIYNAEEGGNISTRKEFFYTLLTLSNKRFRILKKQGAVSFDAYNAMDKIKPMCRVIVFTDDTFSLLLPPNSTDAVSFVKLLLAGHNTGIHCIAASASGYKNLMNQLINLDVKINRHIRKFIADKNIHTLPPLAAEMIINAEDFIFFKNKELQDYIRLYNL